MFCLVVPGGRPGPRFSPPPVVAFVVVVVVVDEEAEEDPLTPSRSDFRLDRRALATKKIVLWAVDHYW